MNCTMMNGSTNIKFINLFYSVYSVNFKMMTAYEILVVVNCKAL